MDVPQTRDLDSAQRRTVEDLRFVPLRVPIKGNQKPASHFLDEILERRGPILYRLCEGLGGLAE
jgi:hypothetical protein